MAAFAGLLAVEPDQRLGCVVERSAAAIGPSRAWPCSRPVPAAMPHGRRPWPARCQPAARGAGSRVGRAPSAGDATALPVVLKLLAGGDAGVRCAAIKTVGRLGDAGQVQPLLTVAAEEKDAVQAAWRGALAALRGKEADAVPCDWPKSAPAVRAEALAALTVRGAAAAVPLMMQALDAAEPAVRREALAGLRVLAGPAEYAELLRRTLAGNAGGNQLALREVLIAVYRRTDRPEDCVAQLVAAYPAATAEGKAWLLGIFGSLGDPKGLELLRQSLESSDVPLRKTALVALATWPDAAPLPSLQGVIRTAADSATRILALRAAATLVGRDQKLPDAKRIELLRELLQHATRAEEKGLIMGQLPAVRSARQPGVGRRATCRCAGGRRGGRRRGRSGPSPAAGGGSRGGDALRAGKGRPGRQEPRRAGPRPPAVAGPRRRETVRCVLRNRSPKRKRGSIPKKQKSRPGGAVPGRLRNTVIMWD